MHSQKPADLVLVVPSTQFQNRIYQEFSMEKLLKGLLIKAEHLKWKMVTFLLYKNIYFYNTFLIHNTKYCIVRVS